MEDLLVGDSKLFYRGNGTDFDLQGEVLYILMMCKEEEGVI